MAPADLRDALLCSICLSIFKVPVTLPCGHNFCQVCIDQVLNIQRRSGVYSCPVCRTKSRRRPSLKKNVALCNVVENFQSSQPHQEEVIGIRCTYCVDSPVLAVKSCLHCEAYLCDKHLNVHSKSPEHVLTDPSTSLENRKCSVHKKILEYYCTEDAACICVSCCLIGEHQGHKIQSLEETSEKKKKEMRIVLQKLITVRGKIEERVQSLEKRWRKAQEKAAGKADKVTDLFIDISRRLDDLEKRVLSEISRQEEKTSLSHVIQKLEMKKDKLSRKMRHIEELCNMTDPLTVLQDPDKGDLCDPEEDGCDEDTWEHNKTHDVDADGILEMIHAGFSDIMTYLPTTSHKKNGNKRKLHHRDQSPLSHTQASPVSGTEYGGDGLIVRTGGAGGEVTAEGEGEIYGHDPADILLDVNTAAYNILISEDLKTATQTEAWQNCPETPERFDYSQVMSSNSFLSGRHFWDVEIGRSSEWRVGMCYPSVDRRRRQSLIGDNNKSWGLGGVMEYKNRCSVILYGKITRLHHKIYSDRVRIRLDYEAGQLSFYDLCDPIRHLHTFTTIFTEPLHAVLRVGKGSIKILGSSSYKEPSSLEKCAPRLVTSQGTFSQWQNQ